MAGVDAVITLPDSNSVISVAFTVEPQYNEHLGTGRCLSEITLCENNLRGGFPFLSQLHVPCTILSFYCTVELTLFKQPRKYTCNIYTNQTHVHTNTT